jgi:hypothetical protein
MFEKTELKNKAINLRRSGLSYTEILKQIPVAKSTLSLWLQDVGLSKKQKQRLTEKKLASARRGGEARRRQRIERTIQIKTEAKREAKELIRNPLWMVGTILYWGEGSKEKEWRPHEKVKFSNMDANSHKIFIKWLMEFCNVDKKDITYSLYIHRTANFKKAKSFWAETLNINADNLRVYFKNSNPKTIRKNINDNYSGLLSTEVNKSVMLNRRIAGWIEYVIEYFEKNNR